ncbi:MAG: hypothetical protein FWH17_04400 [Oscillospiraceae bacterium]|nr:hypothetical protein [Oscillospiraceae bacterium]
MKIGASKQAILVIENRSQPLPWYLHFVRGLSFTQNDASEKLIMSFELLNGEILD